jgi:hypothetical protein
MIIKYMLKCNYNPEGFVQQNDLMNRINRLITKLAVSLCIDVSSNDGRMISNSPKPEDSITRLEKDNLPD